MKIMKMKTVTVKKKALQTQTSGGAGQIMALSDIPCLQKQLQPAKDVLCQNYPHHTFQICSV